MKGLLFQQQLEIRLEVAGEEFRQGDTLSCVLAVKNRGSSPQHADRAVLQLARGESKKVKAKAADAFAVIAASDSPAPGMIAPGDEHRVEWSTVLDKNCLITDKSQSLYLLYGAGSGPAGHLQLSVLPHSDIEGILTVLETSFQFVLKGQKSKGDSVAAKLKPPAGRRFMTVEELELSFRFTPADALALKFSFKVKKLEAGPTTLEIQKKKSDSTLELQRSQYMSSAGYVDPKKLEPLVEEVLSSVGSKLAR